MSNILGIDIGAYSVKAVGLKTTLRNVELVMSKELILPQPNNLMSEENINSIKDFFNIEGLKTYEIIVGIPSYNISTHIVNIPFKEDKLIKQAIGPELENVSPFSLEESIMDYTILNKNSDGASAITFSANSGLLKQFLETLFHAGIDPNVIDVNHCAYSNLTTYIKVQEPFVVIDIGQMHTSLSFINELGVFVTRDIKIGASMLDMSNDDEPKNDAKLLNLVKAIEHAVNMAEKHFNITVQTAIFAGRFAEKALTFGKHLGVPVYSLPLNDIASAIIGENISIESKYTLAFAYAARNIMKKPRNIINLRQHTFQFKRAIEQIRGRMITTISIAAVLIAILITSISYSYISQKHQRNLLYNKLNRIFTDAFPDQLSMGDPIGAMKSLVSKEAKKAENATSAVPMIELLREISNGIPKNVQVDVRDLSVDPEQITLTGKVNSIDAVDKIVAGIKGFSTIKDVEVVDTRKSVDQNGFDFQLKIILK